MTKTTYFILDDCKDNAYFQTMFSENEITEQYDNMGQEEVKMDIEEATVNLSCVKKELDEGEFDFDVNRYKLTLTFDNIFGESLKEQRNNRDSLIGFIDDEVIMEIGTIKLENVRNEEDLIQEIMKQSVCNKCGGNYEGYCPDCSSLLHILNNLTPNINPEPILNTIPINMLEIREVSQKKAVFPLKTFPKGLILGPFEGVASIESMTGLQWKIKDKKLVHDKNGNWMQYIDSVANHESKNLDIFQFAGMLFCETTKNIQQGEELLVCYRGEKDAVLKLDNEQDSYIVSAKKKKYPKVFACTLCCLGFRLKTCLMEHRNKCLQRNRDGSSEDFEITQCKYCKVWLEKQEHIQSHRLHCKKNYNRLRCNLPHHQPTDRDEVNVKYKSKDKISTPIDRSASDLTESKIIQSKRSCRIRGKTHAKEHSSMKENNMNSSIKRFNCGFCKKKFHRKDHLKRHIKNKHSDSKRGISEKRDVKRQTVYSNTEGKKYKCLKNHLNRHSGANCKKKITKECDLKIHIKNQQSSIKEKEYKCTECSYQTNYKSNFDRHIIIHSDAKSKSFECDICQKKYGHKYSLKIHILNHHSLTTYKEYKCSQCSYQTNFKGVLQRHIKTHNGLRPFQCNICEKRFTEKSSLKTHIKNHHSNENEKEYKCSECSYRTNHKGNLKIHAFKHNDVKPFQCELCGKEFTQKGSLNIHITKQHSTIKDKENYKEIPKKHSIHRGIKSFECYICKKKYAQISSLNLHIKNQHSGTEEKKYKCSKCSYRTNHKGNLKIHMNTHSDVKPFGCDFCEKKFTQKGSLNIHIKSQHSSKGKDTNVLKSVFIK